KFAEIVIPEERQDLFDEFIRLFRQCYMAHLTDRTRPFRGVRDTLKRMRDIDLILAVATNKPRRFTVKLLKDLNLLDYFTHILTPEDVPHRKPAPDIILKALEITGTPASETLFIGDTDNDILSGKAAGVWTCGVTYGYGPVELLKKLKPDFLVDRPDGISEIAASSRKERIPEVE
ncbi:MAG TPA: HAD family hydrolase, partial [Bacteroidetes bacterium]|nr:HAD family hydrolase [Bacteroidota bacterium]